MHRITGTTPMFRAPHSCVFNRHWHRLIPLLIDTLLLPPPTPLNPTPNAFIAITRGSSTATRGWLSVFRVPLDTDENFVGAIRSDGNYNGDHDDEAHRFQTPTSGEKANAIDILLKSLLSNNAESGLWIDDDVTATTGVGAVRVLEWGGWRSGGNIKQVSQWPSPDSNAVEKNPQTSKG